MDSSTNYLGSAAPISSFARTYPPSGIRVMFDQLPNYPDVINLCNGEPDFPTPDHITKAAQDALDQGLTKYSPTTGIEELRTAIADSYSRQLHQNVIKNQIMVVAGGTEGILLALLASVDPGDEVIVTNPCYPNYEAQIALVKGNMVSVPVFEEDGFLINPKLLERAITSRTKAVILNYPNNPLGITMNADYANELAAVLSKHKLLIISDEVYEALTFHGRKHYSLAACSQLADRLVVVNSLSKTYSMTGWRIGSLFGPPQFMSHVFRMQESIISCLPVFIQKAALAAINGPSDQTKMMAQAFENRMKILAHGLNSIKGFSCRETEGGLCMMVNVKAFKKTSLAFSLELLEQAGVMTVPGSAFGTMGEGYVRFCYANSEQNIREAVKRISQYIGTKYA